MTLRRIDYLRLVEGVARTMAAHGVRPEDVRYLPTVTDYLRLRAEGHKYEYIMHYLCEQYDVRRTALYKAIQRLTTEIDV